MEQITVIIPAQQFSEVKYLGGYTKCYLQEALYNIGIDADVGAYGYTYIRGDVYVPQEEFTWQIVKEKFSKGQDITVTLIKR